MNDRTNLDRDLSAFFRARSTTRAPAGLLEAAMGGVEHTSQRPVWRVIGHRIAQWRGGRWTVPASARLIGAVVLLLVAFAIGVLVFAGSQRRPAPPFGPAKPGLLAVEVSGHIGLMKPDGTGLNMLTSGPEVDRFPIWSPDGTRIAFVASRDLSLAVVAMDADGGHRVTLADHLLASGGTRAGGAHFGSEIPLSWSPDSRRIVFAATVGDLPELFVTPADEADPVPIGGSNPYGVSPSWSPDGSQIAFRGGEPAALSVVHPDGTGGHQVAEAPPIIDVLGWSPDGTRLAYLAEGTNHSNDLFVVNVDGTGQRDLTNTPEDEEWASWSPDGTRLVYSWSEGATGTFVVDADGTNRIELPTGGHDISTPVWSPDGSRILGYRDAGVMHSASDGLVVVDPKGREEPIFIPEPEFGSVAWQRLAP